VSFALRPYQEKFICELRTNVAKYKRIVGCAATGAGKSKVFITIAQAAMAKGRTVLVITESLKIFAQISAELPAKLIDSNTDDFYIARSGIYIAMAQTLARRKKMIENFAFFKDQLFIIVDEAHIGTPTKLLQQFPDSYMIGFTATPDFRFAKHLPLLYNAIVIGPQPDELVNSGHLASYRHFARVSANLDLLSIRNGEFTEESQERAFESKVVYDGLMYDLRNVAYKKAMIYTASIKHCEALYETLQSAGFSTIRVHSQLADAVSSYSLQRFTAGPINICISVGILTKGFDFPSIDLVVLQRATTSLPLYLQMIGRGSRSLPGKEQFTVLDYGANYSRHGLWDMERDWNKMWNSARKKKESPAPVKLCPSCEFLMAVSRMVCPNCGHAFEKPEAEAAQESKLVEVTEAYRQMVGKRISDLDPKELATYARLKNKKGYASRVARAKEQKQPGYLNEFCQHMGYKQGWLHHQHKTISDEPIEYFDIILR
jgi:superfamily II DNA or RNA helicase